LIFCGIFAVLIRGSFVFLPAIMSFIFNYFVLFRNNKSVVYFQEFEKKPKGWKRKWSWISLGIILIIVLFLIGSFKFMDYLLHQNGVLPSHPAGYPIPPPQGSS
jgi:hypothetical protein